MATFGARGSIRDLRNKLAWCVGAPLTILVCCQARLTTIELERSAETVITQGTLLEQLLGDIGFEAFTQLDITTAEEIENQGAEPGDIRDVMLASFTLIATSPATDLAFLDSLSVYVEAPDLPRLLVASQDDFPAGQAEVALELEEVDLTEYAVSASMTLTTEVTGMRPSVDTAVRADAVLAVGVTLQGACRAVSGES